MSVNMICIHVPQLYCTLRQRKSSRMRKHNKASNNTRIIEDKGTLTLRNFNFHFSNTAFEPKSLLWQMVHRKRLSLFPRKGLNF